MSNRHHFLAGIIQQLSKDEGTRQPSAAEWLMAQDEQAKRRRAKGFPGDAHYQSLAEESQGVPTGDASPGEVSK
ncbi:hypothetical protein [Variovorax ginsengisoli]|uniref:Uncharacterized protein n=1 Tax=Variovorax ginsengisoli TaxID=363844 RepID=A0ABT9SBT6_9BURK|nr:hypothetical protein [Variovorax ginsengisoli]MDP9901810.1 hypothetical protein [Variovorax ginsengisoli]